jgi:tRNA-specific 2-thiouridylase
MSGGVDSSVAAYLLKREGYEVIGLSFELWDSRAGVNPGVCCSLETVEIAREVTTRLGIRHETVDVRDAFYRDVIENFCNAYISGSTPNPCILCNRFIKFDFLLKKAEEAGGDVIATGHYARIAQQGLQNPNENRSLLKKGVDTQKDQSYFLYVMTQQELSKTVFPVGGLRKEETRDVARKLGLASAMRPESQDICFIGGRSYVNFIKDFAPDMLHPGPIVDTGGKVIGEHRGIAFYTMGQRKRLGLQTRRPCYVTAMNRATNTVIVGSERDATRKSFKVKDLSWIAITSLAAEKRVQVKFRSTMRERPAIISPEQNQRVKVIFDEPQWAPAPGQSAVFYDGEVVIGGGIIE